MPFGTAGGKLKKMILFDLLKRHSENVCYRCGNEIESCDELSVEHKKAWLHNDPALFWDLDNVAFSHLDCNMAERRVRPRNMVHTATGYRYGCRCNGCKNDHTKEMRKYREVNPIAVGYSDK